MAYQRSGSGAPLVLVHGTGGFSTRWKPILPALEKYFTVYAVDRRGRGESGDRSNYAIEREFDDVAAGWIQLGMALTCSVIPSALCALLKRVCAHLIFAN